MKGLNDMQRSRLKLTIVGVVVLVLGMLFPVYIINKAADRFIFDISPPWVAFGIIVTTIGGIIGYYVNKESIRPSLLTTNIFDGVKKILPGEDESDPENIPL